MSEENKVLTRRLAEEVWNQGDLAAADKLVDGSFVDNVTRPEPPLDSTGTSKPSLCFGPPSLI